MAIKIEKRTASNRLLKVVSVRDDAIDWKRSFAEEPDADEDWKRAEYTRFHDTSKLVYLDDLKPTFFIFDHPARVDVSRKVRAVYSAALATKKGSSDLFTEVFNVAFLGIEEGFDAVMAQAPRREGVIGDVYMQGLEDSGVFEEVASVFIDALNRKNSEPDKKK